MTKKELSKLSKIERIGLYFRDPDHVILVDHELRYAEMMRRTYTILSSHTDQKMRVALVKRMESPELTHHQALKLINETKEIFGAVIEVNKKFDRMILRERFLKLARLAEEADDYGEARRCYREAARIEELYDKDIQVFDPSQFQPPDIIITSDPSAYLASQAEDAQIVDDDE